MSSSLYIDVRPLSESLNKKFTEVISYPYTEILKDKEAFYEFCKDAKKIVLICRSGRRSDFVKKMLLDYGFEDIVLKTPSEVRKTLNDK